LAQDLRGTAKFIESSAPHTHFSKEASQTIRNLAEGFQHLATAPRFVQAMRGHAASTAREGAVRLGAEATGVAPYLHQLADHVPDGIQAALHAHKALSTAARVIRPTEVARAVVGTPGPGAGQELLRSIETRPQTAVRVLADVPNYASNAFKNWATIVNRDPQALESLYLKRMRVQLQDMIKDAPVYKGSEALIDVTPDSRWTARAAEGEFCNHVGLFIPLPTSLGYQFRPKPQDPSPPHVTFLYLGRVDGRRIWTFLRVCREALAKIPPFQIQLGPVDHFPAGEDGVPWFSSCQIEKKIYELRAQLIKELRANGFEPEGKGTDNWAPHTTLAYLPEGESYNGLPPSGSWLASKIEVWGLPEHVSFELEPQGLKESLAKLAAQPPGLVSSLAYGLKQGLTAPLRMYPVTFGVGAAGATAYGIHTNIGNPARRMAADWAIRQHQGQPYKELYRTFLRGSNSLRPDQLSISRA
jgi:2'-5' RNA ligase